MPEERIFMQVYSRVEKDRYIMIENELELLNLTRTDGMLSETLTNGLRRYEIGAKIRALRLGKKLGLVQLGEHTGLSAALLSKIERGNLFPTLPTLLRIAMVFGVGLDHFFVESEDSPIVQITRKAERVRLPNRPAEQSSYVFESLNFDVHDRKVDIYYADFPVGAGSSEPHQHAGAEFLYVIAGRLVLTIENKAVVLGEGDTIHFDSGVPHSYRLEQPQQPVSAIVVVQPGPG
jgi:transcriptional regulator with XRE-family HTH domain